MPNLNEILGVSVRAEPWDKTKKLPFFLNEQYSLQKVTLDGMPCLFANVNGEIPTVQSVRRHIERLRESEPLPVVIVLNTLSAGRRKALIRERIPFVADGQIYLPFMGVALSEKLYAEAKTREKLMPSSQLLLFSFLYQSGETLYPGPMAEKFGLSAMQITRAVRQLRRLNLFDVSKDGVHVVLCGKGSKRELFGNADQYLISPVREIIFAARSDKTAKLPYAGISALSKMSMLADDTVSTHAYFSRTDKLFGENALTDRNNQVRVEIWKYAPTLLSERKAVADPLSVIASLRDESDPRVEQAIENVLETLWR
jgi:DNA-binding MarR family transcriptional regulator